MRTREVAPCLLATLALMAFGPVAEGGSERDWSSYRGPGMNSQVVGTDLFPADGRVRLEVMWKRSLGSGYSGVSVQDDTAVTLFSDGKLDFLGAFDVADGRERWRLEIGPRHPGHYGSRDGPISTPLIANGTVVALSPWGRMVAASLETGELVWETDLVDDLGAEAPFYGFATSPILVHGRLIVQTGGENDQAVTALALDSGEVQWRSARGEVRYQSPALTTIDGEEQLLFLGTGQLAGLDPETGEVLWQKDYEGDGHAIGSGSGNIVLAEDRLALIKDTWSSHRLVRLVGEGAEDSAPEVWSTKNIKNSYVVPVYHDGFFYGYSTRILSCISADDGERKWRSRQPGDGFPIVVDGHLVIVTKSGLLSVAEASPEGYDEIASVKLFEDLVWTPASFGAGSLFLRSMGEMARVAIVSAGTEDLAERVPAGVISDSQFGRLVEELDTMEDKSARIDEYLGAQEAFPIVEGNGAVHFIYRGPEQDVALIGELIGGRTDQPMNHVPGTDLFYYSVRLEPDARISYKYLRNFEEQINDPLNPSVISLWGHELSVVTMPEWSAPPHLVEPTGARGRIEVVELAATEGEEAKNLQIYLPVGYDDSERRYPVAYVHGGEDALNEGLMAHTLDNLVGKTVEPLVVAFMPTFEKFHYGELMGEGKDEYAGRVVEEIVELVDRRYRTIPSTEARASVGQGFAAFASFYTTVTHPGVFGKLGLQSMMWEPGYAERNAALLPGPEELPLTIYLDWGKYDGRNPFEGWNTPEWSRAFARVLRDKGYSFTGREWNEGGSFAGWRNRTDRLLETLFPLDQED